MTKTEIWVIQTVAFYIGNVTLLMFIMKLCNKNVYDNFKQTKVKKKCFSPAAILEGT